ncbi:MAG: COX15/CtaA family protein [Acidobacteria bacterium]|nr:COX15/CtaA family protein [Acidobacteriota bacterium]
MERLNGFALLTAAATVGLIVAGAAVTSTGSGDAVPDWPLSYGGFFPPMVGGVLYEHTHRLVAGVTGLLIALLAFWLWRRESRPWVRWLGLGAVLVVLAQALLGGLRVLVVSDETLQEVALNAAGVSHVTPVRIAFSVAHASLAQIVLCLTFALATVTSPRWLSGTGSSRGISNRLKSGATVLIVLLFGQLLLGALMRHLGAGLVIPDFPLSFGRLVPPLADLPNDPNAPFAIADEELRLKVLVHFAHRVGALAVAVAVLFVAWPIFRNHRDERRLVKLAAGMLGLTAAQVVLGASVIWSQKAVAITVAHVAFGAVLLGSGVVLWLWTRRLSAEEARPSFAFALRQTGVSR